ncbi:hypothetical protein [uncultured Kordia sp.]|uniref:hypothetical protein n=1 Tax=uncultured Kordia sp. TaxID=507699 RepID=UPI0026122A1A|nr:hypothetical protein [uncultured Kordia sp.]
MENQEQSQHKSTTYHSFEELAKIAHENEEEIIAYIKKKALKATLEAIQPLLDKLEEAAQQQKKAANQNPTISYENQLQKLQANALDKMKIQEQRIQARMQTLQNRMSKH